jgi:hypothetical protein
MSAAHRGEHRADADPRRVPKQLAEWAGVIAATGLTVLLFFVALDPATAALQDRLGEHPLLLMFAGWLPVGGFLCAAASVALRYEWLRRRDRRMGWVEEHLYAFVGVSWFWFAMLMIGKQGRREPYDPRKVIEHVALTSESIAWGVAAGVWAFTLTVCLALAYVIGRFVVRLPGPGWPFAWTVASWLFGGAAGSLTALLVLGAAAT